MTRTELEQVLAEQREEIAGWGEGGIVPRAEARLVRLDSDLAQVVIGVRRSGKSTLCQSVLRESGLPFAYVNFDDERLAEASGQDLNVVLEILYKLYGEFRCLFLDEIQNIPEWYLFVNRLLRRGLRILVTGSNAKLLGGELATHLTGRYNPIELLPFSFGEYCAARGVDSGSPTTWAVGARRAALDAYLHDGAFPALVRPGGPDAQKYLEALTADILERDIRQRYHLRHATPFRTLAHYLLDISPAVLNYTAIRNRLALSCSTNTLAAYVFYLKQAYLLLGVRRWSTKSHVRLRGEKVYPVDVSLMDNRRDAFAGENLGWRLETAVLLELLRRARPRGEDVYYYQDARNEADFVVCRGRAALAVVQVAYALESPKVRARELRGAVAAAKAVGCGEAWVVTHHEREETVFGGLPIHVVPAHDWLPGGPGAAGWGGGQTKGS